MSVPSKSPLKPFPALRYDSPVCSDCADDAPASPFGVVDPNEGTDDMEVHGVGSSRQTSLYKPLTSAEPRIDSVRGDGKRVAPASTLAPKDAIEIAPSSRAAAKAAPSLRAERLAQIKASIEDGSYDTPERLEAALDRMFSQIGVWDD